MAAQSTQRVRDNLAMLARQCAGTSAEAALEAAARGWEALAAALDPARLDRDALLRIDALAGGLLDAAEQLTQALQEASGRRALHIVNVCGRQRMRAQRIAKLSLVCTLLRTRDAAAAFQASMAGLLDDFEAAQRELERTPLRSPDIRQALAAIGDEWLRLLGGLRAADTADGRRALVHASETMLERLDALTAAYEHRGQVTWLRGGGGRREEGGCAASEAAPTQATGCAWDAAGCSSPPGTTPPPCPTASPCRPACGRRRRPAGGGGRRRRTRASGRPVPAAAVR